MIIKGNVVDIHKRLIYPAEVTIENGKIQSIVQSNQEFDTYLLPGFVDGHIHIESTLLAPSQFALLVVQHGTVATVSDPHEIANVLGIAGVKYMIADGKKTPFKFYFGAPSCVPATEFETAGAKLGSAEIEELMQMPEVKFLSEFMNYPGVLQGDPEVIAKLTAAKKYNKVIDGHAPQLTGETLKKYVSAGITTDHECANLDEAVEKITMGMKILIREGSAARNFDTLVPLFKSHPEACMFCCDDIYPNELLTGHINTLVRRAVALGYDVFDVLRAACVTPVTHYNLDVGLLRVGDNADLIEVADLKNFMVRQTILNGAVIFSNGKVMMETKKPEAINNFKASPKHASDFAVRAAARELQVIEAIDGQLLTNRLTLPAYEENGFFVSNPHADILKIVVVNRYQDVKPAVGFIKNFGLKKGALASSVAHDSHNIVCVGVNDSEITSAVNAVIAQKGGLCAVDGKDITIMSLPIAGLMSDKPYTEVAQLYEALDQKAKTLGTTLMAPFMTLSFMSLLVIPHLKLSDKGLFDGDNFAFINLQS